MKTLANTLIILAIAASFTGCLKTRAQLKDDNDNDADKGNKPVHAEVQDVQPQAGYAVDELKGEITRLEGRIEDIERTQKSNPDAVTKEDIKKLETRIIELEQAQASMLEAIKKLQDSPAPLNVSNPSALMEKGRKEFDDEEYEDAVNTFTAYLKIPKVKAEEATFLRAESFYKLKQYKKAIVDYSKFPEKFTHSTRMSLALYKIGLSFEALGMKEDAKGFYQELVEKFPKSTEAKKVRPKLK